MQTLIRGIFLFSLLFLISVFSFAAPAGGGYRDTVCQYATVSIVDTGSGTWTAGPSNPATTTINNPTAALTTVTGFTVAGTYLYIWHKTGGLDTIYLLVNAKPNAGADQTVSCFVTGSATLTASGTGSWSALNPGGSHIVSPGTASTGVTSFSAPGIYLYVWTIASGCTDTANITVGSVANDACNNATSMGTLPAPPACTGNTGFTTGNTVTLSGQSNVCASPSAPFPYQVACPVSITSPPKDVWYSFVASSTRTTISVSGATFANPVIAVWAGTCGTLTGIGCTTGSAGAASLIVYQLTIGTTYYIQVSGPDSSQSGTFSISANSSIDCSGCLVTSHITATPLPVNGTYFPGQTVTFCYTVSSWNQTSANWLHGVIPTFGSGWDMSTLVTGAPPGSCSHDGGHWSWHNGGDTSVATGNKYPAGFFYETLSGSSSGVLDNSAGNNFGDNDANNTCTWSFCVTITSLSTGCLAGENLSVSFHTTGDGESGSWNSFACSNDPTVTASNVGACCPPTLSTTGASCNHNDGTATAVPTGIHGPWKFLWSNGVVQNNMTGPSTITGLVVGLYTVTVIDVNNCISTASDSVRAATKPNGGGVKYVSCPQLGDSALMTAIGTGTWYALANPAPTIIVSPDSAHTAIKGFTVPATYYYVWSIGNCLDTVPVIVTTKPNAGPDQNICTRATATMGAFGTGTWSALPNNPAPTVITIPTFDSTTVNGFTTGGSYGFVWTTSAGCSDTMFINVPNYNITLSAVSDTICQYSNTNITVTPTPATFGPFVVTWLDSNKVVSPHSLTTTINSLASSTYFHVIVTDAAGCSLADSIRITTTTSLGTDIRAGGFPTTVCPGTATQLTVVANPNNCGAATTPCTAPGITITVGAGTGITNGPVSQYPAPYGNAYKSARHQFLIHASELLALIPSGGQIKSLSLDIGTLNGGAVLSNFTISLACVPDDSLANAYLGGLTQVYTIASYQPVSNWNTHVFQTAYNWDGRSNLVVDVCFTNTTSGSINPKMVYTTTPFRSVWCTFGNFNGGVCGVPGSQAIAVAPAKLYQRPNIRFNMCITDLTGANIQWTPNAGANAPTPTNLDTVIAHPVATTTYQVALTSANGCVNYDYVTINVDTSTKLTLTKDTFICTVQPVQLKAVVSGTAVNQAQVQYTWTASDGTIIPGGLGATYATVTVNPTASTVYTVSTTGGGGCSLFDSVRVTLGNGLPVNKVVDSISCAGGSNGEIDINMTAGIAPFRYTWTPAVAGNTNSAINLPAGTYIVQVMDTQGCVGKDTTKLVAPSPLTLRLDSTNILCYNVNTDNITATVTGGRKPYRYTWSPLQPNTPTISNVPAGTYSLTVHDTSGCTISGVVNITQPAQVVSGAAVTNLSGAGTHDGTITISTTGGTPAYSYTSVPAVAGLPNATGLDTGIYIINVCDANLCCIKDTAHITGPPPILVTPTIVNNQCFGQCTGQISVSAVGGVTPYTFLWNTTPANNTNQVTNLCTGSYRVTITDANGISVANTYIVTAPTVLGDKIDSTLISCFGGTDGTLRDSAYGGVGPYTITWTPGGNNPLSGLGAGTYHVQVTDANNCIYNDSASLGQPPLLSAVLDSTYPTKCFGDANGRAVISVTGGTKPYAIVWTGSSSVDTVATDLAAGAHTVTITDAHGCSTTVTLNITQPQQLAANISTTAAHCATSHDGSATAAVSNGTPAYIYTWDATVGTSTITGLAVGGHTLQVTDQGGCTITQPFAIDTQYVLHISLLADSVTCFNGTDGQATVTVANGNPAFSYQWDSVGGETTNPATGLSAGIHIVTVTDSYQCVAKDSATVYQPSQVYILPLFTQPLCTGDHNGKIWLTASGGQGPYIFTYNGVQHQMTDTLTGLGAGDYIIAVTDNKGCVQNSLVTLVDPLPLLIDTVVTPISCANTRDGAITVNATGGTPGYTYIWTPAAANSNVDMNLGPGTYTIQVKDANGCSITVPVTLVAPPRISFTYVRSDSTSCSYSTDGHIVVNVTGGTPGAAVPYSYAISGQTMQADSNFYNLPQGVYQIAVTDGQKCQLDTFIDVYSPLPISVSVNPMDTLIPLGSGIELDLLIGNVTTQAINSYNWTPTVGLSCVDCPAPIATPYQKQDYIVVVNYGKNCIASAGATVRVSHGPDTYIPNAFSPNGDGTNDEFTAFGTSLKSVNMRVFNRWGEKVFDSGDEQWASWDGTYKGVMQPTGVYTYVVELVYLDGVSKIREGSITLIR